MSAAANNILRQVQTYQPSGLMALQNHNCFLSTANKKFENFQNLTAQLGSTVQFEKPYRSISADSLVATYQPIIQRFSSVTVDKSKNSSFQMTTEQFLFNLGNEHDYMKKVGFSAIRKLGSDIEVDLAKKAETNTYRFYGDGRTNINSITQLAEALAKFENYGAVHGELRGYLYDMAIPSIVASGLGQYVFKRNDKMANSWEVADFANCNWYKSNQLAIHTAGTAGNNNRTLTVFALGAPNPDGSISQITFTVGGAPGVDANCIKAYDKIRFNFGVANQRDIYYLNFTSYTPSSNPVEIMATADAASDGASRVVINFNPPLQVLPTQEQNINTPVTVGMQATVLPNHRCGLITSGNPLFLAMPRLGTQEPFYTANESDDQTGANLRLTFGTLLGQNLQALIHDVLWGSTLVDEYAMMMAFPIDR